MKNIFIMIGRAIAAIFLICTIAIMIIIFKGIDNAFTLKFISFYCVVAILTIIYSIISLSINIKKLKLKSIINLLIQWVIWSLGLWILTVLFTYLIKGELRLTDKISDSVGIAFGCVFGGLIFGSRDDN